MSGLLMPARLGASSPSVDACRSGSNRDFINRYTRMVSVMRVHHVETQNLASLRWVKPTMPE
ncbi:MAG: hypothetical protein WD625_10110, partial [Balneolales bacterium]